MTTIEIKNQVIGQINQLTDNDLLMDLYKLLNGSIIDSDVYQLSENHKSAIDSAIIQIDNGDFLTNTQAYKDINEWLNK